MNAELLTPEIEVELDSQDIKEEQTTKEIEQEIEIECPRCHDVMSLSSEFDKLLYFCQECGLSLIMK